MYFSRRLNWWSGASGRSAALVAVRSGHVACGNGPRFLSDSSSQIAHEVRQRLQNSSASPLSINAVCAMLHNLAKSAKEIDRGHKKRKLGGAAVGLADSRMAWREMLLHTHHRELVDEMEPHHISRVLWALTTWSQLRCATAASEGFDVLLLQRLAERLRKVLHTADSRSVTTALWAFASLLQVQHSDLQPSVAGASQAPYEGTEAVWRSAVTTTLPPLLARLEEVSDELTQRTCANSYWALGRLHRLQILLPSDKQKKTTTSTWQRGPPETPVTWRRSLLDALDVAAARAAQDCSGQVLDVAQIVWGMGVLRHYPSQQATRHLIEDGLRGCLTSASASSSPRPRLSAQALANIFWAFGVFAPSWRPSEELLGILISTSQPRACDMPVQETVMLLVALARLTRESPGHCCNGMQEEDGEDFVASGSQHGVDTSDAVRGGVAGIHALSAALLNRIAAVAGQLSARDLSDVYWAAARFQKLQDHVRSPLEAAAIEKIALFPVSGLGAVLELTLADPAWMSSPLLDVWWQRLLEAALEFDASSLSAWDAGYLLWALSAADAFLPSTPHRRDRTYQAKALIVSELLGCSTHSANELASSLQTLQKVDWLQAQQPLHPAVDISQGLCHVEQRLLTAIPELTAPETCSVSWCLGRLWAFSPAAGVQRQDATRIELLARLSEMVLTVLPSCRDSRQLGPLALGLDRMYVSTRQYQGNINEAGPDSDDRIRHQLCHAFCTALAGGLAHANLSLQTIAQVDGLLTTLAPSSDTVRGQCGGSLRLLAASATQRLRSRCVELQAAEQQSARALGRSLVSNQRLLGALRSCSQRSGAQQTAPSLQMLLVGGAPGILDLEEELRRALARGEAEHQMQIDCITWSPHASRRANRCGSFGSLGPACPEGSIDVAVVLLPPNSGLCELHLAAALRALKLGTGTALCLAARGERTLSAARAFLPETFTWEWLQADQPGWHIALARSAADVQCGERPTPEIGGRSDSDAALWNENLKQHELTLITVTMPSEPYMAGQQTQLEVREQWVTYPGMHAEGGNSDMVGSMLQWIPRPPQGARVLDLCCGTGILAGTLEAWQPNMELHVADADAYAIAAACKNLRSATFHVSDGWTAVAMADTQTPLFDMVLCNPPLHNVWGELDPRVLLDLLDNAPRYLHGGGEMWIVVPVYIPLGCYLRQVKENEGAKWQSWQRHTEGRFNTWRLTKG